MLVGEDAVDDLPPSARVVRRVVRNNLVENVVCVCVCVCVHVCAGEGGRVDGKMNPDGR